MASNDPPRVARPAGGSLSGFRACFWEAAWIQTLVWRCHFLTDVWCFQLKRESFISSKCHVQNHAFPLLASSEERSYIFFGKNHTYLRIFVPSIW
jgi:hypothetical protein